LPKPRKQRGNRPRNFGKEKWSPKLSSGDDILIEKITTKIKIKMSSILKPQNFSLTKERLFTRHVMYG
jgi:hypothetical protein